MITIKKIFYSVVALSLLFFILFSMGMGTGILTGIYIALSIVFLIMLVWIIVNPLKTIYLLGIISGLLIIVLYFIVLYNAFYTNPGYDYTGETITLGHSILIIGVLYLFIVDLKK